jgi:hypothetical protein
MKAIMAALLLVLGLLVTPGTASDPLRRVFPAPVERVWTATLTALATQGWGLDDADRTIGAITTKSHRVQGDDGGPWARNTRLRLRVTVLPVDAARTTVAVEREVFRRERVFWVERDERIDVVDLARVEGELERFLLSAIARAL